MSGKGCDFVYKNGFVLNISSREAAFVLLEKEIWLWTISLERVISLNCRK